MKISKKQINSIVLEELKDMLNDGQLSEEQIQEFLPKFLKNWWKDLTKPNPKAAAGATSPALTGSIYKKGSKNKKVPEPVDIPWLDVDVTDLDSEKDIVDQDIIDSEEDVTNQDIVGSAEAPKVGTSVSTEPSSDFYTTSTDKPGQEYVSTSGGATGAKFVSGGPQQSDINMPSSDSASSTGLPAKSIPSAPKPVSIPDKITASLNRMAALEKQKQKAAEEGDGEKEEQLRQKIDALKSSIEMMQENKKQKLKEAKTFKKWKKLAGIIKG